MRCATHFQNQTLQAMLLMTNNLSPGPSRRLREVLLREQKMLRDQLSTEGDIERRDEGLLWWPGREDFRERSQGPRRGTTDKGVVVDLQDAVKWRLATLCACIPGDVEPKALLSFVDLVVTEMVAQSCGTPVSVAPRPSNDVARPRELTTGSTHRRELSSITEARAPVARLRTLTITPVATPGANASPVAFPLETSAGSSSRPSSLHVPGLSAAARQARWALVTPAAAAICKDFQAARSLVTTLRTSWKPVWPADRSSAEALIQAVATRLSLDSEDRGQLLQDIGLAKPRTASCSWFPCRISW